MNTSELQTPFYYIDKQSLDDAIERLKEAINYKWPNTIIGYSFKTNSLPWIVQYMKEKGFYAEVVSDDEYNLAVYNGYENNKIIYNGIAKSKESFLSVIKEGGIVNIDSSAEIGWLYDLPQSGKYRVGLRVNFDLEKDCPNETSYGEDGSRFGFCLENGELYKVLQKIKGIGNIEVSGLHMHSSTKTRSLNVFISLTKKACAIAKEFGLSLSYIDIGGGFYGGLEDKPSFDNYFSAISTVLKDYYNTDELVLIIEPGVSIIGPYISYVTSVVDIKDTTKNRFVVTDGSRVHIDTRMVKKNYFKDLFYSPNGKRSVMPKQVICGFTCMEADRIITIEDHDELKVGDRIVFHKVGAYTLSFAPLFIKYFPDVYLRNKNEMQLLRKRWSPKEYSQNCF